MFKKNSLIFILIFTLLISPFLFGIVNLSTKNHDDTKKISLILKTQSGDYWKNVRMGAEVAAKEFNVKVDFTSTKDETDIDGQAGLVNDAIQRKTDALILALGDNNRIVNITEKAVSEKIPVLVIDSKLSSNKINSYIATNNIKAGKIAGEKLISLSNVNSRIAIINFTKESSNNKEREDGLMSVISKHPEMKVVYKEPVAPDSESALVLTKKLVLGGERINSIIALNYISSIGVAQAIDELGLAGKINVITFDNTPEEIEYLEKGVIEAIVTQSPFGMGYLAVKYAVLTVQGKKIPKYVDTGLVVIDRNNMYLPKYQKILFPFTQ
ncbi:substrate-binding domain-containing protein [Clostridium estertheticum]|uniref:substrate-binding domain-containing protein n=1 Tax=Clostridium estertheticum TaxID=238834 RepID=UPI001C0E32E9|nr:substrate-binding domain-containing protein [Clostridium estertheticum]MBU3202015.1 substrate-binding domain-containing protein [Clostridium estertheticum]WAG65216.1 substrate-binding domain-containing protein [Clostridium estertheticum]